MFEELVLAMEQAAIRVLERGIIVRGPVAGTSTIGEWTIKLNEELCMDPGVSPQHTHVERSW